MFTVLSSQFSFNKSRPAPLVYFLGCLVLLSPPDGLLGRPVQGQRAEDEGEQGIQEA